MTGVLILGATSAIAEETARIYAGRGAGIFLVGRNESKLEKIRADLEVRGASRVGTFTVDLVDSSKHAACIDAAKEALGRIDVALIAHGTLGDQKASEANLDTMRAEVTTNALSAIELMSLLGNLFESQGKGTIAVISSVAGERGRQSNYVYGASKAMVTRFAQGLRNRLFHSGAHVVTILPGFVDTPMTADFDKGPLWASAADVASGIVNAIDKQKNVVYLPWFWFFIMLIIRNIPEFIFKRLRL